MFIIYVLTVFVMLLGFTAIENKDLQPPDNYQGMIHANHMISWHKAAVEKCSISADPCSGGTLNPEEVEALIPSLIRNAPSVVRRNFRTNYDNGSGYLVTYMDVNTRYPQGITFGTVASSFGEMVGNKTSSSMGIWNRNQSRVDFMRSPAGKRSFSVPADIPSNALVGVPDKSPVLLTRVH